MPALKLDQDGLTINDLNDVYDFLVVEYKKIYGEDIILTGDTPDGQVIAIYSKLNADAQASLLELYNSFDPDNAVGSQLNKIIKLSGLTRKAATKSTVTVDITATTAVSLDDDYSVVDTLGQSWVIQTAQEITAGTTAIDFSSNEWGSIAANAATITEQGTILTQITAVNNPLSATIGVDEETDEALRIRRERSLEKPAFSTTGSLLSALLNIENVVDAIVYENQTNVYDSALPLVAHSIWCIVDGGLSTDIIEAIAKEKTVGCGLKGSIEGDYTETFVRADGTSRVHIHPVAYDVPTSSNIYINVNVTPKVVGGTIDTALIKDKIAEKLLNIAEDLIITELYSYIYQAGSNFVATNLTASLDNITYVSDELAATAAERLIITTANITVTVV